MDETPLFYVLPTSITELVARENLRPDKPSAGYEDPHLPDEIWVLAERCWSHEPSDRPLAKDICDALEQITDPATSPPATPTDESQSMVSPRNERSKALSPDASERDEAFLIASEEIRQSRAQKDAIKAKAEHLALEAERQAQEESARAEMAVEAVRKQEAETRAVKAAQEKREREHAELVAEAVRKQEVRKQKAETRTAKAAEEKKARERAEIIAEAVKKQEVKKQEAKKQEVRKQEAESRAAQAAEEKKAREHAEHIAQSQVYASEVKSANSNGVNARATSSSQAATVSQDFVLANSNTNIPIRIKL